MPETKTRKQDEAKVDVKLMKALGHPLRQRILQELDQRGEASPSEIAEAINEPLTNVSYHVKILKRCDAIELTRTEVVRSAVERFYRPKIRSAVDEGNWRNMPENVRESLLDQTMQQIWSNVRDASSKDALKDINTTVAWDNVELDKEGFAELSAAIAELMNRAKALESAARMRLDALSAEDREEQARLVELDAMLYPITERMVP